MRKSYRFKISRGKRTNRRNRRLMMKWGYGLTKEDRLRVSKRNIVKHLTRIAIEIRTAILKDIGKKIIESTKPITPAPIKKEDLEYIEAIKTTRADLVRVFGIKAHLMGGLEWRMPKFATLRGTATR